MITQGSWLVTMDYAPEVFEDVPENECEDVGYGATYENTLDHCLRWHSRLNSLVLEEGSARRVSMIDLDADVEGERRSARQAAVSNERVFFQRNSYEDGDPTADPEFVALGVLENGEFVEFGALTPEEPARHYYLAARGKRAFVSGSDLEVVTSTDDEPLESTRRSWSCSRDALEVTDEQASCASGVYGVKAIPLD